MTTKDTSEIKQPVNYLEEISNFIFLSKYSRYNEKLGRRESWGEAVSRGEAMHLKKYYFLSDEDKKVIKNSFDLVREKFVVPSMRSLQFGGKAIETKNEKIYNCFEKNTEFVTDKGVRKFSDFKHGDSITVLSDKGNWQKATVVTYGHGNFNKITISKGKHEILDVLATDNHRWILKDDTVTESLSEGDLLKACPPIFSEFVYEDASPIERLYWCYGYVFGDGTKVKDSNGNYKYSMVRLCGKADRFKNRFEEVGFQTSSSCSLEGDFMAYSGKYLKTAPNPTDSPNLIRAFVKGYLDADGEKSPNSALEDLDNGLNNNNYVTIQSSEQDHIDFIRKFFPVAGVYIVSETDLTGETTNFGVRPFTIKFRLTQVDVVQSPYRVKKIIKNFSEDHLWCLQVENDQSFVFPNGLTTGNCAVRHVDSIRSFSEILYLLLCGCGVGLGISKYFLNRLPDLANEKDKTGSVITYSVLDSIEGWADSVEVLLMSYFKNTPFTGRKIVFDYSKIREEGQPLKTSGGKAPGYKGLKNCHRKIKELLDHCIEYKHQNRLKTVNAYDIIMHCADATLSGGVRRSATSVIFDKNDEDMINAKAKFKVDKVFHFSHIGEETVGGFTNKIYEGKVNFEGSRYEIQIKEYELEDLKNNLVSWVHLFPQRARSNNSVLLLRNETTEEEFAKIIERTKQFGEPGFVWGNHPWQLFNPCFEIGFIPVTKDGICGVQFCNLTSQNGRKITSKEEFTKTVIAATIIGTLQAGYTHFPYLSKAAEELTSEEALLGVSITGMMDNPDILLNPSLQKEMANLAIEINKIWSYKLHVNQASRITCIKPEGTSSLILGTGSGIHAHHAKRYFRRVQVNKLETIYKFFKKHNPKLCEPSVWSANKTDDVVCFPIEVSDKALIKGSLNAIEQLKYIKFTQKNWVLEGVSESNKKPIEHNVSCTVIVKDNEWADVIKYIYENRNYFAAISFVPDGSDKIYQQAPMEAIVDENDEKNWKNILDNFNSVDYKLLKEDDDNTTPTQEIICAGGACSIV